MYLFLRPSTVIKPASLPPPAMTAEQAITKAQQYLLDNSESITPQVRIFLDFLHRKFALNEKFSGQISPINTSDPEKGVEFELLALRRIAYKDSLITDLGPNPTLLARGANCDHIPLPSNISSVLQQEIDKGEYELTHAALSMQFMEELGCTVENADALWTQAINGMTKMVSDEKIQPDLRYECFAFLLYMGYQDSVKLEWINQIIPEQLLDGGWAIEHNDIKSNDHSTLLALWALLEYSRPNTPDEPLIRRPGR